MENPAYTIRKVTEKDLEQVLKLIHELAIFERAAEEVTVTLDELIKDYRADIFTVQVAETPTGNIIGMAFYYITYSTWKGKMLYLEDLVVTEAYRRKGIGKQLFDTVIKDAKRKKCKLMKWQVLDWNTPAIDFYKNEYNAIIETAWYNGKIFFKEW